MSNNLAKILQYVKEQRDIDFGVYRPSTIQRRLEQRITAIGAKDSYAYLERLTTSAPELDQLITTLTVTTSEFFRNPFVFEVLAEFVLPELLETFHAETLRILCAGCARGEEPYSVAILIKNLLGAADKEQAPPVIVATDIDKAALGDAEKGFCHGDSLREVRKGDLERYFELVQGRYRIAAPIRSMVIFAYHDVTSCLPPRAGVFSDYHLILCRNLLIYFNRDMQERIISCFHGLLRDRGYLVLGEAEMIMNSDFTEAFPRTKIFRKGGRRA